MSTCASNKQIFEDDISDRKMSKVKEGSKPQVRDRQKRPDKQLYVPRALRKTENRNAFNEQDNESIASSYKSETSLKFPNSFGKNRNESLLLKQKEKQNEVGKACNSVLNDVPSVTQSMLSVHTNNDVKVIEDATCVQNCCATFKKEQQQMKEDEPCLNVTKCTVNISLEKNPIELNDKRNSETFDKLENNLHNTESLKKENLNYYATKQEHCTIQDNNYAESTEDSWEAKFNDEGDCLDPKLVKKLCDITGRVDLTIAKEDYSDYQPIPSDTSKGYDNIVELFGFPVAFSTQDLTSAFSAFQSSSYNIKWVDDCHALAIFSSPLIANQALHLNHPFIKVRPLCEGIKESKEKARLCTRMFENSKPRPVTSAVLARRLVSGALGLKVKASKEQRDMERIILQEAREKKKLKAKQRQDIWNGIVS